jgi:apolipoprotein N-acyltransferase
LTGLLLTPQPQIENRYNLDVAIVQPNIHLSQKWKPGGARENIASLLTLSKPAILDSADLLVWPESATSAFIMQGNKNYLKWIQSEMDNTKLLSGIPYYLGEKTDRKYYNSAALISVDSISVPYHKLVLVPMAEHIPLSDYFPSLKELNLGQANFTHGNDYKIFNVNNTKIAAMICFESTIPELSRKFVKKGVEILIFLVNDGWYEHPPEPQQHARQAIYRAVENRRPVIRCTNTGISMIIDPSGNITQQLQLDQVGVISANISPKNGITFYTHYGDIFAKLNSVISLFFILGIFIRKK